MALVDGNDDVLHCDVTLVGSDGVSVEAHRALLHARCPKLFQQQQKYSTSSSSSSSSSSTTHSSKRSRLSPSGIASPMLSPPAKAGGNNNDDEGTASITVSDATGRALSGVVRFVYSDTLPAFDEMDEQEKKASGNSKSKSSSSSSSSSSSTFSSRRCRPGWMRRSSLVVARALSSTDAPAMQHLQAPASGTSLSGWICRTWFLCWRRRWTRSTRLCSARATSTWQRRSRRQRMRTTPARLVTSLGDHPAALSTAISAAAGSWFCPATPSTRRRRFPAAAARCHGESLAPRRHRRC